MNIGDKVKPSKTCRPLYGDPDYLTIKEIKDGKYLTEQGSTWFEEHELTSMSNDLDEDWLLNVPGGYDLHKAG